MPRGIPRHPENRQIRREQQERLLERNGMMTIQQLATLWGVNVKTLQNRATKNELPPHSRVGGKRLFFTEDVMSWMRDRMTS